MLYPKEAPDEEDATKKCLCYLCVNVKCGMLDVPIKVRIVRKRSNWRAKATK